MLCPFLVPEARKGVAHGASRGSEQKTIKAPDGATGTLNRHVQYSFAFGRWLKLLALRFIMQTPPSTLFEVGR
jgi:hypothetical protein